VSLIPSRTLLTTATAVATLLLGATVAAADVPGLPPGVTLPPRASDTVATTTTVPPPAPTTTAAPAPAPPTAAPAPGPAGVTQILPAPPAPPAPTAGPPPAAVTRILPAPDGGGAAGGGAGATTTTLKPGDQAATPPAASSLTPGQVDDVLRSQQRSGANSTGALLEALRALQNFGMTAQEAAALGMGQFPVQGLANWTDDFGDPRSGPPPHQHQGNDLFTQFDTPVRAPADGTVRYETGGLGGLAAYVTTSDGTYYYMAHLNSFAPDLTNGAPVKQGRVVGFAGDSGNAKGGAPHVHFEIHPGGGAATNPKPIVDGWVAAALANVPALVASFQPPPAAGATDGAEAGGVPQILVATGLTRRFSAPSVPSPAHGRSPDDFNRAVLVPLTPPALAALLDRTRVD
jgi:murein DD-endopeptidase MepM/ murein hydrolase activator NlpD